VLAVRGPTEGGRRFVKTVAATLVALLPCAQFPRLARAAEPEPRATEPAPPAPSAPASSAPSDAAQPPPPPATEVTPPRPLSDTGVDYPGGASGDARVELELVIDASGAVTGVRVISGDPPFADAARAAAEGWRFEPARRGGVPMAARIRFGVGFEQRTIDEGAPAPGSAGPAGAAPAASATPAPSPAPPDAPPAPPAPPAPSEAIAVTVSGARPPAARIISRAFARELPGAFGNPFAAIEASPGVTPTLSGAPYFYVRGAPPGNLGYFIDDIRLPALFHVLAGPSVLHPALVESLEFYPGPYPARYGRFTGGIAAGQVRRPSYALHGELSVRAFDSSGLIEVPLATGELGTSLTLAGRVSYANPIAHLFAPEIDVSYWDYQARFSHQLSPRDELAVMAFGSRDQLTRENDEGRREVVFGNEFHRVQLRYQRELAAGSLRIMGVGGWDRSDQNDGDVRLTDTTGRVRADLVQDVGHGVRVQAGVDLGLDRYSLNVDQLEDEGDRRDYLARYPTRFDEVAGGYVGAHASPAPGVRVDFGSRVDVFGSRGDLALGVSPSVFAELDVGRGVTLVHGLGLSHQPPSSDVPQPGTNPVLGAGLQHALQYSAGARVQLPADLRLELTLYQMALFNLSDGIGISRIDNGDDQIEETSRALGASRGLEVLLERELSERLAGYLAYTLGSSRRSVDRAEGPALFDRRHVLSGALSYRFTAGFRAGVRATFYTGVPADVAYLAAAQDPPRTTPFYRIDLRLEKRWRLNASGAYWAVVLELLNSTLRQEALGKSCSAYVCREDEVGPITIPSLGVEAMF
jgi:TonB family protein